MPLTSNKILVSILENSLSIYPIAIGPLTLGPKVPLVISPIGVSVKLNILVFSLAINLPSGLIPTLICFAPFLIWLIILSEPTKPPFDNLSFEIAHLRFASTGVLLRSSS